MDSTCKTSRIVFFDLAKGLCIILVVFAHLTTFYKLDSQMPSVISSLKAIRMPLYFYLSGLFFKRYEGFWGFAKRKINKILIPFAFFYITTSVILPVLAHQFLGLDMERGKVFSLCGAFLELFNREMFPNPAIWFLLCLFEMNILFYLICLGSKYYKSIGIIVISIMFGMLGVFLSYKRINLPIYFDTTLTALPFFCAGYLTRKETKIWSTSHNKFYLLMMSILCVSLSLLLGGQYVDYRSNCYSGYMKLTIYPCGLLGTFGILYLAQLFQRIPVISYFGRYSIIILCTHCVVYQCVYYAVNLLGMSPLYSMFLNLVVTMLLYLLIIPFAVKYMPRVTAQKDVIQINDRIE